MTVSSLLTSGERMLMVGDPEQKVLQQICAYSEEADVNVILKYYLKKVVEKQPDNVIDFLLEEIATNPYTPPPKEESK